MHCQWFSLVALRRVISKWILSMLRFLLFRYRCVFLICLVISLTTPSDTCPVFRSSHSAKWIHRHVPLWSSLSRAESECALVFSVFSFSLCLIRTGIDCSSQEQSVTHRVNRFGSRFYPLHLQTGRYRQVLPIRSTVEGQGI